MKKTFLKIAQFLVRHDASRTSDPMRDDYCICGAPRSATARRNPETLLKQKSSSQKTY